jgi:hypothetical protein
MILQHNEAAGFPAALPGESASFGVAPGTYSSALCQCKLMKFSEAVKRLLPLQVRLPDRYNPLLTVVRYVAEVFIVETIHGPAIVWLDPFWSERSPEAACHIAYVRPDADGQADAGSTMIRAMAPTVLLGRSPS